MLDRLKDGFGREGERVEGTDTNGEPFSVRTRQDRQLDAYFSLGGERYYAKDFRTESPVLVHRMIDLSLGHLTPETIAFLDEQGDRLLPSIILFEKETYGYFIPIVEGMEERDYPEDLRQVLQFAVKHHCTWLMLDVDGTISEELKFYS